MGSAFLRRLILCLLLAAIPVQGIAAAAMLYCCDGTANAETSQVQDASEHPVHPTDAAADVHEARDAGAHHAAHADSSAANAGSPDDTGHDGHATQAKCSVCAAFCSGGVIVSGTAGVSAPLPCLSSRVAAPATRFSSFFPDLAERPPLALL